MADKFGMMSQAYFKGKRELLEWISDLLEMDIPKVEVLASGAHYCQLLDACHPGSIKMSKVNFGARTEDQFVQNWKLIQIAFEKKGIQKLIPVLRLIKARFQDNLEFLQWFHQYFQSTYHDTGYDPTARRKKCKGANQVKSRGAGGRNRQTQSTRQTRAPAPAAARRNATRQRSTNAPARANPASQQRIKELQAEKTAVEAELSRISKTAQLIENERDFYFKILLKVETMCKESPTPDHPCIKKITQVLYTSSEESPRNNPEKTAADEAVAPEIVGKENIAASKAEPIPEAMATDLPDTHPCEASVDLGQGEPLVGFADSLMH